MTLQEYKNKRIKEIKYYLRGINYKNLESETKVEGLPEELDALFNRNPLYKEETATFVVNIRNLYDFLLASPEGLEFAETKVEVDEAIQKFEIGLKMLIKEFKNKILKTHSTETGYHSSIIDNNTDSINIKIRDISEQKLSRDEIHNLGELCGLKEIFFIIHMLIYMIKDKTIKAKNLNDLISLKYKFGTPEYKEKMRKYIAIVKNERDYNIFLEEYNKLLDEMNVTQDDTNWLEVQEARKTK